jgi:biopolymer transport protein ExbD
MFAFAPPRARRKPSLTPMIDVVFLLLVFFMLASQFGRDNALPLTAAGGNSSYSGPPRLVLIGAEDLRLNGVQTTLQDLPPDLRELMQSDDDTVVLRSSEDTSLQRLVDVAQTLRQAGITRLAVVE